MGTDHIAGVGYAWEPLGLGLLLLRVRIEFGGVGARVWVVGGVLLGLREAG